ncbi:TPA: hypothetical protein QDZ28_004325 [Pseudomonas putida]|nr:hypothetical protein [Pseudomonas putida]
MNKTPAINATSTTHNVAAYAACMDELAVQMVESAGTLRESAMSTVAGNAILQTVTSMELRASQIRNITAEFRLSGDLASFDQACQLAGWSPDRQALASLQVAH